MKVLITGGAGYIGSTIASACLDNGVTPIVLDNLSTGAERFLRGRHAYVGDIADCDLIDKIFAEHPDVVATIHAAALVVVPQSVAEPVRYYRENVAKSLDLVESLVRNGCSRLVLSSSAAVYGDAADPVMDEATPIAPTSPYGRSKAMTETILRDSAVAYRMRIVALRYFNPIGADPALRTGMPRHHPTHLLGQLVEAVTQGETVEVTGCDWPTPDGSGIRDYLHVWDLAHAHVCTLRRFDTLFGEGTDGFLPMNLGSGHGTTVFELIDAVRAFTGAVLPVRRGARRTGDVAGGYAPSVRARALLGWRPTLSIEDGIRDTVRWAQVRDQFHVP